MNHRIGCYKYLDTFIIWVYQKSDPNLNQKSDPNLGSTLLKSCFAQQEVGAPGGHEVEHELAIKKPFNFPLQIPQTPKMEKHIKYYELLHATALTVLCHCHVLLIMRKDNYFNVFKNYLWGKVLHKPTLLFYFFLWNTVLIIVELLIYGFIC